MSFLYFLPGHDAPLAGGDLVLNPLEPYGLGLSLADVARAPKDATAFGITIEGVAGCLLVPHVNGAVPNQVTYRPDLQTWLWVDVGGRRVGIGFDKSSPPNPSSLARSKTYQGIATRDASGVEWVIPIARAKRNVITLPSEYDFDPISLEAIAKPSSDFDDLWRISGELFDHWNGEESKLSAAKLAQYALQALAVNYRVGPLELLALKAAGLKVIDDTSSAAFGLSLIDWQFFEEVKKKQVEE